MTVIEWCAPPIVERMTVYDTVVREVTSKPNTWAKVATMRTANAARNAKCRLLERLGQQGRLKEFEVRAVGCELFVRYRGRG